MRRRTRTGLAILTSCWAWSAWSVPEALGGGSPAQRPLDANRLRTGRFVYRILEGGKEVARIACTVRKRSDQTYAFTGDATGAYSQHWESAATRALAPISASLRIGNGQRFFELRYDGDRVTGRARRDEERSIDERLPAATAIVDQRIDWAAVLSTSLEPGQKFEFSVYDPWSGIGRVIGRVGADESIRVAAGSFTVCRVTYRIESAKGSEPYEMLAARAGGHLSVRETFPSGTVSELVEIQD